MINYLTSERATPKMEVIGTGLKTKAGELPGVSVRDTRHKYFACKLFAALIEFANMGQVIEMPSDPGLYAAMRERGKLEAQKQKERGQAILASGKYQQGHDGNQAS